MLPIVLSANPIYVFAHGSEKHNGKPMEGTIVSIDRDTLVLKGLDSSLEVVVSSKTLLENHGDNSKTNKKVVLKAGQLVQVFGTKLPGGKMVAKEIIVKTSTGLPEKHQPMDHSEHEMGKMDHRQMHDNHQGAH
jgi:hypothetical protein